LSLILALLLGAWPLRSIDTRGIMDGSLDGCDNARVANTAIVLDSIVVGESTATVHAIVWRGEYRHLETFSLAGSPITRRDGAAVWFVYRLTVAR